jgi:hypothetical protein
VRDFEEQNPGVRKGLEGARSASFRASLKDRSDSGALKSPTLRFFANGKKARRCAQILFSKIHFPLCVARVFII